jgi:hypothetical protein
MKKVLVLFLGIFLMCQASVAQDIETFVKDFSKTEGVEHIRVGGLLFKLFIPKNSEEAILRKLTSVEVFMCDEINMAMHTKFLNDLANFKDGKGFEMLVKVKEGNDNVTVFAERKKDIIKSLTIFVADEEDIIVVKLNGKIKDSDIAALVNKYAKTENQHYGL